MVAPPDHIVRSSATGLSGPLANPLVRVVSAAVAIHLAFSNVFIPMAYAHLFGLTIENGGLVVLGLFTVATLFICVVITAATVLWLLPVRRWLRDPDCSDATVIQAVRAAFQFPLSFSVLNMCLVGGSYASAIALTPQFLGESAAVLTDLTLTAVLAGAGTSLAAAVTLYQPIVIVLLPTAGALSTVMRRRGLPMPKVRTRGRWRLYATVICLVFGPSLFLSSQFVYGDTSAQLEREVADASLLALDLATDLRSSGLADAFALPAFSDIARRHTTPSHLTFLIVGETPIYGTPTDALLLPECTDRWRRFVDHGDGLWTVSCPEVGAVLSVARVDSERLVVVLTTSPELSTTGRTALIAFLVVVCVWALMMAGFVTWSVSHPVAEIASIVDVIASGDSDRQALHIPVFCQDDLGRLSSAVNRMVDRLYETDQRVAAFTEELEQRVEDRTVELRATACELRTAMLARDAADLELAGVHEELLRASRVAGMAEIATGILHNVGNALTSVNASSEMVTERVGKLKVRSVGKAADLLVAQGEDLDRFFSVDPRAKHFVPFLQKLSEQFSLDQAEILAEMMAMQQSIEHIKAVVSAQQDHAKGPALMQRCRPAEVVEAALAISGLDEDSHGITVVREDGYSSEVVIDRHKVLQILINLLTNAKQAVQKHNGPERRITVRTEATAEGLRIAVEDTGEGISADNTAHIFAHGFTTKKDGHGFGLHSSALAATEMGGELCCHSAGEGLGATFQLEIPGNGARSAHAQG